MVFYGNIYNFQFCLESKIRHSTIEYKRISYTI